MKRPGYWSHDTWGSENHLRLGPRCYTPPPGAIMKKASIAGAVAVLAVLLAVSPARTHSGQNATRTERAPQFENEEVKVWKSVVYPNEPLVMHRHDHPRVIVALKGGTMEIVDQSGTRESHVWETGKAYWLPANPPNTQHADVNKGDGPIEVMVVELIKEK